MLAWLERTGLELDHLVVDHLAASRKSRGAADAELASIQTLGGTFAEPEVLSF